METGQVTEGQTLGLLPVSHELVLHVGLQGRVHQTFPVKDWAVNILGFGGHTGSVETTQLHHSDMKATIGDIQMACLAFSILPMKLYLQRQQQSGFSHGLLRLCS
jgi:hypothetical protein